MTNLTPLIWVTTSRPTPKLSRSYVQFRGGRKRQIRRGADSEAPSPRALEITRPIRSSACWIGETHTEASLVNKLLLACVLYVGPNPRCGALGSAILGRARQRGFAERFVLGMSTRQWP